MKKILKYAFATLLGAAVLTGCETENKKATTSGNGGATFQAAGLTVEVTTAANTFNIPLIRDNADGSFTTTIILNRPANANYPAEMLSFPANVTFADGQLSTTLPVTLDIPAMTPGVNYALAFSVSNPSLGAVPTITVRCSTPLVWGEEIKIAKYTAGAFSAAFYGSTQVYYVKYQKAEGNYTFFRLINAYQPETTYEGFPMGSADILPSEMLAGDHYLVINALDPEKVIIDRQGLGFDWGYGGEMTLVGDASGKLENNVVTIRNWFDIGDGRGARGVDIFDFNEQQPPQ